MSETDVSRLMKKVDEIGAKLERIDERLNGYNELKASVVDLDKRVELQTQKCITVQSGKTKVNWGTVLGSIIGMVVGGSLMLGITRLFN